MQQIQIDKLTLQLWSTIFDRKLQPDTELKILYTILEVGETKEKAMEQQLLDIVNNSKTEAEILEKISHL